jgi:O-antigen ligase
MALKHKLINDGYVRLAEENMHTHNQVFHTWLDLGILGVLLLAAILLVSSQVFSRLHNRLAWWLLPLIVMNILTDDMLEVQAGTVFFAFFLTLFIYQRNNERLSYS